MFAERFGTTGSRWGSDKNKLEKSCTVPKKLTEKIAYSVLEHGKSYF